MKELKLDLSKLSPTMVDKVIQGLDDLLSKEIKDLRYDLDEEYWGGESKTKAEMNDWLKEAENFLKHLQKWNHERKYEI